MVVVNSIEELKKLNRGHRPIKINEKAFKLLRVKISKAMKNLPPSEVLIRQMRDAS